MRTEIELQPPIAELRLQRRNDEEVEVFVRVIIDARLENSAAGLALQGSRSMRRMYGHADAALPTAFATGVPNRIEPIAQQMGKALSGMSSDHEVNLIYWSCGAQGSEIESLGTLTTSQLQDTEIRGPKDHLWGRRTTLLPAVRYFMEQTFANVENVMVVFVTNGILDDHDDVLKYSHEVAAEVVSGKRQSVKFVLLGVGDRVDVSQMYALDDMECGCDEGGNEVQIWEHKLVSEIRSLHQVFAEVMTEDLAIAPCGRILDAHGNVVTDYPFGLPGLLRFTMPDTATQFTLDFPGGKVTQHFIVE